MLNQFMRAEEVARELEVSKSYAYKLIQQLNAELREKGYITIAGRVNRQYFRERLYLYEIQLYMIIFSYVTKEIDNTGQENI